MFRGSVWKQSTRWSSFKNLEKQLLWLRRKNDIIGVPWARVIRPWDGVWQEDGEHRVLLLKDTVSTTAQKLGLWVPGVKFFGILKAFRSLCYREYSRLETLLPSNFKMTPIFSYFCDICNRICNFSLRIKYHLFHDDNNFLIFAVTQPQNSCLQFYFFTLIVLHSKSTSSHCIILWNLDIWWMNMHSLYCGFCLHSQPLHMPSPSRYTPSHLHIH